MPWHAVAENHHHHNVRCDPGSRIPALLVTLGGLLAVLGGAAWLLATSPAMNAASVLAFGGLVVVIFAGAAMTLARPS